MYYNPNADETIKDILEPEPDEVDYDDVQNVAEKLESKLIALGLSEYDADELMINEVKNLVEISLAIKFQELQEVMANITPILLDDYRRNR